MLQLENRLPILHKEFYIKSEIIVYILGTAIILQRMSVSQLIYQVNLFKFRIGSFIILGWPGPLNNADFDILRGDLKQKLYLVFCANEGVKNLLLAVDLLDFMADFITVMISNKNKRWSKVGPMSI